MSTSNPVINRLVKLDKQPTYSILIPLTIGGFIVMAVAAVGSGLLISQVIGSVGISGLVIGTPLSLYFYLLPLVTAGVAAALTHNDMQSDAFRFLGTTLVEPRQVMLGYVAHAFHRLRVPIATGIVLLPAGLFNVVTALFLGTFEPTLLTGFAYAAAFVFSIVQQLVVVACAGLVGITLAAFFDHAGTASGAAVGLLLAIQIAMFVLSSLASGMIAFLLVDPANTRAFMTLLAVGQMAGILLSTLAPGAVLAAAWMLAQRAIRRKMHAG
ncbi:MAG: hypothetical protein GYB64_08490 [Chloroflexi bacterium]|nr:hypothetical protein [Chloroflexota bacterium]